MYSVHSVVSQMMFTAFLCIALFAFSGDCYAQCSGGSCSAGGSRGFASKPIRGTAKRIAENKPVRKGVAKVFGLFRCGK